MINYFQKQYNYYFYGILDLTDKKYIEPFYRWNNKNIKKIIIGNTIVNIGYHSFRRCNTVQEIDFSNSIIKKISFGSFSIMPCLKTIYLPENIELIENFSFCWCSSLESIYHYGIKRICSQAFLNCNNLKKIFISDELHTISTDAFTENMSKDIEITCPEIFRNTFLNIYPNASINENTYILK